MYITIINDSCDDNAKARQETRWATLFPGVHISFIGVNSKLGSSATLEATGNLIDTLDAGEGNKGIVALNVAPRGQKKEDGENGSPFCYFYYKKSLVVSTIKDYNLSLIRRLNLVNHIFLLNNDEVLSFATKKRLITTQLSKYISKTQFRSFDFQPRVARWLFDGIKIPVQKISIQKVPSTPKAIWHIDSFGNIKTTLFTKDLPSTNKPLKVILKNKKINMNYYNRLKDIPNGETAIYTGSSGIGKERFLEIATQNRHESIANKLNLSIGSRVKIL